MSNVLFEGIFLLGLLIIVFKAGSENYAKKQGQKLDLYASILVFSKLFI